MNKFFETSKLNAYFWIWIKIKLTAWLKSTENIGAKPKFLIKKSLWMKTINVIVTNDSNREKDSFNDLTFRRQNSNDSPSSTGSRRVIAVKSTVSSYCLPAGSHRSLEWNGKTWNDVERKAFKFFFLRICGANIPSYIIDFNIRMNMKISPKFWFIFIKLDWRKSTGMVQFDWFTATVDKKQ